MRNRRKVPKTQVPGRKIDRMQPPTDCRPGSIEQELDMCERGPLRGDEILHDHGVEPPGYTGYPRPLDRVIDNNYEIDMAEEDREGDEMSGDEHSAGLQGGEPDLEHQRHIATGLPGDRTEHEEMETRKDEVSDEEKEVPRIPEKKAG